MTDARRLALVAGLMYIVTFLTSIPALPLLAPVTEHADFVLGNGADDNQVLLGGLLEVLVALSGVATALALYPVTRRVSQGFALGFVTSRLIEGAMIMVGVVSILSVVSLRQELGGEGASSSLLGVSQALIEVRDWTFVFGPGVMPAINAVLLATVLYKAGLVPKVLPVLGLVGAPILLASSVAVAFGGIEQYSPPTFLYAVPIALWEISLGFWLTFKGFRPSPVLSQEPALV